MKKIYIIDQDLNSRRNGIGTYVKELLNCFAEEEYNLFIISFDTEEKEFRIVENERFSNMRLPGYLSCDFMNDIALIGVFLKLHIKDEQGNVFLVNYSPCSRLLTELRLSFPLSKQVFVVHDLFWTFLLMGNKELLMKKVNESPDYAKRFEEERHIFNIADKTVCLNTDTFNLLVDVYKIDQEKLIIIPNGLSQRKDCYDKNLMRKELGIRRDERLIIFVGRLISAKGIEALWEALDKISQRMSNVKLVIVGAREAYYDTTKERHRLSSKIIYTGQLNADELLEWYSAADVGVIPSYSEQCTYVGIEMMMHRLAIVASNGFGVKCMFKDKFNACVAIQDENYASNLAEAIVQTLCEEDLNQEIRKNAEATYFNAYSTERMRINYQQLINTL